MSVPRGAKLATLEQVERLTGMKEDMTKPEDVPSDIWDAAYAAIGNPDTYMGPLSHAIVLYRVAKAILAEREACDAIRNRYV